MRLVLALLALGLVVLGFLWFAEQPAGTRGSRPRSVEPEPVLAAPAAPEARAPAEPERRAPASIEAPPAPAPPADDFPRSFLAGLVVEADGTPAPEVMLEVRAVGQLGRPEPLASLRSGTDGRFETTVLGSGPFRLEARETSGGGVRRAAAREPVEAGEREAVLRLPRSGRLQGRVSGDDGKPVTAFTLELRREEGGAPVRSTIEAADGRFTSEELVAGLWELSVIADGYAPSTARHCSVPSRQEHVVLYRAAHLSGVVRTTDGRPRPGARVEASTAREPVFADAQGAFTLETNGGTVSLQASDPAGGTGPPIQVDVAAGEQRGGIVLSLGATGLLAGRVVTLANRPAAAREVRFEPLTKDREHEPVPSCTTDALGNFLVDLSPGRWEVSVVLNAKELEALELAAENEGRDEDSLEPFVSEEVLVEANEHAQVWLALAPAPVRVSGRLTKAGEPCDGGEVVAVDHKTGFGYRARVEGSSYVLGLGRAGQHLFHVTLGNTTQAWWVSVPADGTHELDLDVPVGWISGRVVAQGDESVADVAVWADAPTSERGGGSGHARTDAEGNFTLELAPGSYAVTAGEREEGVPAWSGREGVPVVAGEHWTGLIVYLARRSDAPALEVELRGPHGELVPGAEVTLTSQSRSRRDERPEPQRQRAPEGITGFRSLRPGPYAVVAEAPGYVQLEPVFVAVEWNKPKRTVLALARALEVVVTLKSGGASGPVHALDAVDTRGLVTDAEACAAPEPGLQAFRFPLLAAGEHRLRIRAGAELLERPLSVPSNAIGPFRHELSVP